MQTFLSDGVRIAYLDFAPEGADLGEPILLIHGFASSHRINWVDPRWATTLTKAGRRVDPVRQSRPRAEREALRSRRLRDPAHGARRRQPARSSRRRPRRRDGLFDGRAHRAPSSRSRAPERVRSLILGGLGDPSRRRRRPAARHRRRHGGALARRADRSDAAHVPRLRRPEPQRPARRSPPASAARARR